MSTHRQNPLPTPVRASIALAFAFMLVLVIYLVFDVPIIIAMSFAVITGFAGALLAYVTVRVFSTPGDHYGTAKISEDEWRARLRKNIDQIIAARSNADPLPFDDTDLGRFTNSDYLERLAQDARYDNMVEVDNPMRRETRPRRGTDAATP